MVCVAPAGFSSAEPYAAATRAWAQGVEMQLAMAKYWLDMAAIMNPFLPSFDVHKLAAPHPAPAEPAAKEKPAPAVKLVAKPAARPAAKSAAKRKPAARSTKTAAKPAPRRRRTPSTPEQPFKD